MNGWFTFLQEFVRHPRQVASVVPSSRFLERRIVETAGICTAKVVVELGPGTGGTTRAIELNPHLHALVSRIGDPRLIPHLGDARELSGIISSHGLDAPDAVISGIPFSTIAPQIGHQILEAIHSALAPGGRFVAYQVNRRVATLSQLFPEPDEAQFEFLNIPPLRIFRWEKNGVLV
jgi:phospholipid N-methyltransferase